jgi:hypothetical protein
MGTPTCIARKTIRIARHTVSSVLPVSPSPLSERGSHMTFSARTEPLCCTLK